MLDHAWARRAAAFAIGAALACGSSLGAAQTDQDRAAARSLATQGGQALVANKYAEALDLVTRAEAVLHAPTHLLMIARAQVGLGKLVAAQETYLKLTREELAPTAPQAFKNAQADGRAELAALEPKIASVKVIVPNANGQKITLKIDETPVPDALVGVYAPADPGHHVVYASTGAATGRVTVDLAVGEKKEVTISLWDQSSPPPAAATDAPAGDQSKGFFTRTRVIGLGVGAVGLGGVVLGAVMIATRGSVQSTADKEFAECNPHGCTPTQESTIKSGDNSAATKGTVSVIGFAAGGALLLGGASLVVFGGPKPAPTTGITLSPYFAGESGGVRGQF